MASKRGLRRRKFRRSCAGKTDWGDPARARLACRRVDPDMQPYRCIFCGGWHVGHPTGSATFGRFLR